MSDSTRETRSLASKGRRALTNPWLWLAASVAAHLLIFGTATVVRPKDGIVLTAGGQRLAISPQEAGEIVQNLASRHADDVRTQIAELKKIAEEMKAIEAEKQQQFKDFSKESTTEAPQKIAEATAAVEASQRDAVTAQDAASKALSDAVAQVPAGSTEAPTAAAGEAQTSARRNQVAAQEAQDQAINHLKMLGPVADAAIAAQRQASDLQSAAGMQQDYANAARLDARAALATKASDAVQKISGAADAQRKATELQQAANQAQAGLHDVVQKVIAKAEAGGTLAATGPAGGQATTMPADPDAATQPAGDNASAQANNADIKSQSLAQLYNQGVAIEGQLAQTYRTLRAEDLAMIRKMSLADALKLTELTRPDRPQLDAGALNQPITSGADMQRAKDQIGLAAAETSSMVSQGRDMLAQAKGLTGDAGSGAVAMDQVLQRAANTAASERMAADDGSGAAKDMTGFALRDGTHGGLNTGGANGDASDDVPAIVAGETGAGRLGHRPHASGIGNGDGGIGGAGRRQDHGNGRGNGTPGGGHQGADPFYTYGQAIRVPGLPPMDQLTAQSTSGRAVANGLANKDWMYVDTWYLIGPFPNPNRVNINRQFPPDQQIDLDAVYLGKDNRKVRWQFYQSPKVSVSPPDDEEYQIYYAYTELYFDAPRDLWVFIGSDDQSRMYINDICYWKSSDILKGWKADEGKRKIHFNKGVNRILFRVENGWHSTAFSMILQIKNDG